MIEFLQDWVLAIWAILLESGPYLLLGFLLAGLLKVFIPEAWIYRHLGHDDLRSVTIASLFGIPIPLCSCSVIPSAIALKKSGASKGATTAFLISTPETGVDSVGITWALMDPIMTIMRPLAALFTALGCGVLVNGLVRRGWDEEATQRSTPQAHACHADPEPVESSCHQEDATASKPSLSKRLSEALKYALGTLMADLTPWFIIGFLASGLILLLVPDGFFVDTLPGGWVAMLSMLVVGIPFYICATASTPIAAALMAKGLEPGAALVLLLAGPATNVATLAVVRGFLGKRVLLVYLAGIALFSLTAGWIVQSLYGDSIPQLRFDGELHEHGTSWISIAAAVFLSAMLLYHAIRLRLWSRASFKRHSHRHDAAG